MTIASSAKDGIVILSEKPIQKQKNRLVASDKEPRKSKNLEELLVSLSVKKGTSYVADKDNLYEITSKVNQVPRANESIAEVLINNYEPARDQYVAIMRNGKPMVIDDYRFTNILAKATKSGLPGSSRKKLVKKLDQMIDAYYSHNIIFKKSDQKRISRQAEKIPEQSIFQRGVAPFSNVIKKTEYSMLKKKVASELDRLYFRNKRQDLLLMLNSNRAGVKNDVASVLMKDLGAKEYFVFDNIPYVAVPCSSKDIDRVCYALNNRKNNFLKNMQAYSAAVKKTQRSSIIYTPELFTKIAKDMGLPVPKNLRKIKDEQWNLRNVNASFAWEITKGRGASVFVVDTGVDYNHPEISNCFEQNKGYNFVSPGSQPMDDHYHGTHVAGTVAGEKTGVAPQAALYAGKVLDRNGSGSTTDIIRAIDYGIKQDFDIITMSLGSPMYSYALNNICKEAYRKGVIVYAAAGNECFGPEYPASCDGVISVAAVDSENKHAEFSNIHKTVDISAPGVNIYSIAPKNSYKLLSGTSMATPHGAGVAALACSVKNSINGKEFEDALKHTAKELGAGEYQQGEKYGAGLMQADMVVRQLYKNLFKGVRRWR